MAKVFVEREGNSRLRMFNTLGRKIEAGEFVIVGAISGVALEDTLPNAYGAFHVETGLVIQVGQADFASTANFGTANVPVYFDSGEFNHVGDNLVGQVVDPLRDGVVRFAKYFRVVEGGS